MLETVLDWLRARRDPLRGEYSAARWAASVSSRHNADVQKRVVETLGAFPTQRKRVAPEHFDALIKIDQRIEGIVGELESDFVVGFGSSADEETRLWRNVFELTRVLLAAYQHAMKFAMRGADRRWSTRLPLLITRLAWYKSVDARLRLYRYARWSAAQWREMHQLYELARARRWHHRRLAFGDGEASRELPAIEEIYLRTLLEQRMDSGNFTPDQVAWVAERLRDWSVSLKLEARRREHAGFFVDPGGSAGLRRIAVPVPMSRVLYLDARPLLARIDERLSAVAAAGPAPEHGEAHDLPPAEERLVLSRLHGLFVPEEAALPARAERQSTEAVVPVALGLRGVASVLAATAAGLGAAATWRTVDRSRTGFRLIAPEGTRTRIGDLIALEFAGAWRLGAVRRMVRLESEELTLGVEVIGHRALGVTVTPRSSLRPAVALAGEFAAVTDAGDQGAGTDGDARTDPGRVAPAVPGAAQPAVYLPACAENRDPLLKSIVLAEPLARPGDVLELQHESARYLVRLGSRLEAQADWAVCAIDSAQEA